MILEDVVTTSVNVTPVVVPDCQNVSLERNGSRVEESKKLIDAFKYVSANNFLINIFL